MYRYDELDKAFVSQRAKEFRSQVERRLKGELSEEEFRPLRLMNGVYLQLHAYMLRVAIPYGELSSKQMHMLAHLSRKYDKGYGHFTTRQNIQYNWPQLIDIPDMLDDLASVDMHAIQTSGNCIRNVTSDPFAGVAYDELEDPRPTAELLRQWSSLHPEFLFLPRKFKIAIHGAAEDRAAIAVHDIGIRIIKNVDGETGYQVLVGGGQGRTPRLAAVLCDFVTIHDLLPLLEAIMRVYNLYGRRDNKYKARIKILVEEMGIEAFSHEVMETFAQMDRSPYAHVALEYERIKKSFALPDLPKAVRQNEITLKKKLQDPNFARFLEQNIFRHKVPGYSVVSVSLKPKGGIPGDASAEQMDALAKLADRYSQGFLRITHRQNIVLPYVATHDVPALYDELVCHELGNANIGSITDIISCPGLDYCALATARSIPIAQALSNLLDHKEQSQNLGSITLNISGCINACGHHHVANIGILGLNKKEKEYYQITLGGSASSDAAIGKIIGRGFDAEDVPRAVDTILNIYVKYRLERESFNQTLMRIGEKPFKEALYGTVV